MVQAKRYDEAIQVANVEAEYRIVGRTPCPKCGNRLSVQKQTLLTDANTGKHYDLLETECKQCGTPREFLFDINSFFGKKSREDENERQSVAAPKRKQRPLLFGVIVSVLIMGMAALVSDRINLLNAFLLCLLIIGYFAFEEYRLRKRNPPSD